jgi:hypothetical protein
MKLQMVASILYFNLYVPTLDANNIIKTQNCQITLNVLRDVLKQPSSYIYNCLEDTNVHVFHLYVALIRTVSLTLTLHNISSKYHLNTYHTFIK